MKYRQQLKDQEKEIDNQKKDNYLKQCSDNELRM